MTKREMPDTTVRSLARNLNEQGDRAMAGDEAASSAIERMLTSLTDNDYKRVFNEMRRTNHDLRLGRNHDGLPVITFRPSPADIIASFFSGERMKKVSMTLANHSTPDICRRYDPTLQMVRGRFCYRVSG